MNSFQDNLETMKKDLVDAGPVFLIGHSMGGLYALHLTQHTNAVGGVSISTPLRGSSTADWAKYMVPNYPLFRDVGRRSKPVLESMKIQLNIPWTQLISTTGSVPYHGRINDGVVTVDSMRARDDVEKIELAHNHYEIVCSDDTAEIISTRYQNCC
jgi:pimeloyl-ACP methyl ester carboxylesterase